MIEQKYKLKVFGASWCAGCKQLKAALESKGVEFEYIDIDSNADMAQKYGVRSLPTSVIHQDFDRVIAGNKLLEIMKELND